MRNPHIPIAPVLPYVRTAVRAILLENSPRRGHPLDIGVIDIEPAFQACGLGQAVLERLPTGNPLEATFVESVSNPIWSSDSTAWAGRGPTLAILRPILFD